jgi:CubicO group peptidase (beta-lactamase class C family)
MQILMYINVYLKDFQIPASYHRPIILKDLMTHTAGFEDLATGGRLFVDRNIFNISEKFL